MGRPPALHPHHRRLLKEQSAISDEVIRGRRYRTVGRPTAGDPHSSKDLLKQRGIPRWMRTEDARFPGILIPLYRATGENISWQYRPDIPPKDPKTGKLRKYAAQAGRASVLDVHPFNKDRIVDPTVELWITEGVKKGDALTSAGACVVTLSGVFNWRSTLGSLGDWEDIPLKGRPVLVCFDADANTNPNVAKAMERCGKWLVSKGATVRYVVTPAQKDGVDTKGADDYLAAGGTLAELRAAAAATAPTPIEGKPELSDAILAQDAADEALDGFRWAQGLGWLAWDGRRWRRTPDEDVREQVRQWVIAKFRETSESATNAAARDMREAKRLAASRDAWFTYMGKARIDAVTVLARGILREEPDAFDSHSDLLNAGNGVIDLTTGELLPHDPELLLTKLTGVNYRPDAQHRDWATALEALPADVHDWYRIRCGQATTGHMPPDDLLVVQQGGGENGKTTIARGIERALGDYFTLISHRALMGDPGQHPTELMAFRGARFALLEETPEERHLSVVRLKQTVGTPQIRARYIRQDEVEFDATHSLFLSSNYKPLINETDHGTWRRLALLRFPYTFRKRVEGAELVGDWERWGDPTIRARIEDGADGQHEAVLAWLVSGAVDWYKADRVMPPPPERVERDTRSWRAESDQILGYLTDRIVIDPHSHVMSRELLEDFNEWLSGRGHRPWGDQTFSDRFGGHSEVTANRIYKKNIRRASGLSRTVTKWGVTPTDAPARYRGWVGLRFRTTSDDMADDLDEPETGTGGTGSPVNSDNTRGTSGQLDAPFHPFHPGNPASPEPSSEWHFGPGQYAKAGHPNLPIPAGICEHCGYPGGSEQHRHACAERLASVANGAKVAGHAGTCPTCKWELGSPGHAQNCLNGTGGAV